MFGMCPTQGVLISFLLLFIMRFIIHSMLIQWENKTVK